jgi:ATP-dependent RNA helicase DeaD
MADAPASKTSKTFAELGLPAALAAALAAREIVNPTPVQAAVIPLALGEGDILAQARTGSGKTLAFLLPLTARIAAGEIHRAWIVCPTRELAQQCAREAATVLGEGKTAVLVGGVPAYPQVADLRRGVPLVIGTPGRMCDHLTRGALKADAEIVVLDEADQMLDLGFADDLERLVKDLGESCARWLFSATFPPQMQAAVGRWLDKPREVRCDTGGASTHVRQFYTVAPRNGSIGALARLLHALEPGRAMVFVRTREDVEGAVRAINGEGIEAAGISGELAQDARERVLARFREGKLAVLVGTDVAARGIDVPGVSHVFNLGLPTGVESYTHRIGRTARAGADGEAWTVIQAPERARFMRMSGAARCKVTEAPLPTGAAIVEARRERLAKRVQETLGVEGIKLPPAFAALVKEHTAEIVLAALVRRLVPDSMPERAPEPARGGSAGYAPPSGEVAPLFIGLGMIDGVNPGTLVALLCHQCGLSGSDLGKIKMFERHSLVEVAASGLKAVLDHPLHHRGRAVPVRLDRGPGQDAGPPRRYGPPRQDGPQRGYGPPRQGPPSRRY